MTQAVNLANFANNLDTSGGLAPSVLNAPVPVSKGGTNASTAADARTNLGLDYSTIYSAIVGSIYPVGSLYFNATNSTNPATLLGFGTWVAFGAGRVPTGFDASNSNFDAAEKTGGSQDAIVVSHTHTATVTDPGHNHYVDNQLRPPGGYGAGGTIQMYGSPPSSGYTNSNVTGITVSNSSTGSSGVNGNLSPYITVYIWKRTA